MKESDMLVSFEDLVAQPKVVLDYVASQLELKNPPVEHKRHKPSQYLSIPVDETLLEEAQNIYQKLLSKRSYLTSVSN